MPDHPLLAVYMLGCYGWLVVIIASIVLKPDYFERVCRDAGMPRMRFAAMLMVFYSELWPTTICGALAMLINERRGR